MAQIGIDGAAKGPSTSGLLPFSRRRANGAPALHVLRASCTWPRSVSMGLQEAHVRIGYGPFPGGEQTRHTPYRFYERAVLGQDRYRRWAQTASARMGYGPLPGSELTRHTPYKFYGRSVLGQNRYRCGPKGPSTYGLRPFPGCEVTRHTPYKVYGRVVLGKDRSRWGSKRPMHV